MIIFFDQTFPFLKYSYHTIIKVVWKTGNLNSRRAFKPPDWNQMHTQWRLEDAELNSRGLLSPW